MASHQEIDERSLALAQAIAEKVDADPRLLEGVRAWLDRQSAPAYKEWSEILKSDWPLVRETLLDPSEEGKRLRQSSPFVGILSPQERWRFFPLESAP